MMLFRFRTLGYSIAFHLCIIAMLSFLVSTVRKKPKHPSEISLWVQPKSASSPSLRGAKSLKSRAKSHGHLDLRPGFAKNFKGIPFNSPTTGIPSTDGNGSTGVNSDAQDLLRADGRSLQAFDQLALMINGHLDYPEMLAENGIHGMATLDLYFDHNAQIDESRSRMLGDSRWIRGLFVKAARIGIEDWFRGMGGSLNKDQFRDQHFRADFIITYTSTHSSELEKNGEASYHLVRRQLVQTCLNPAMGGLDVTCAAMRVAGIINSQVSSNYKIKFQALKDRLEQFDETGLAGLNQSILHRSET